jgi:uncharacterized protein (TIGR03437 family)
LIQIQNPIDGTDTEYGGFGAANEIVASATEGQYDDLFIAIPAGTQNGLQGNYQAGFIDFLQGNASNVRDGYFTLSTSGSGSFGNVTVTGAMANQNNTKTTQTLNGVTFSFSGSTGTITFPTASNPAATLVSGTKTFAVSTDGNIIVGGSSNGFDIFVGMKSDASNANSAFTGTYFTGAVENDVSGSCGNSNCIDSYYGSVAANGQGAGTQHSRFVAFDVLPYDYTTDVAYNFPSTGTYNDGSFQWMLGTNGEGALLVGTGSFYSLIVAFQAKQPAGSGFALNPLGIVNAASFAPITNSVAPGEYVALFGSSLATTDHAQALPLPTTLGGSQVTVNSTASPLLASAAPIVTGLIPNEVTPYDFATFQVKSGSGSSAPVTLYTAATAPGVFTATANGIGPADLFHLDYSYVTQNSPAAAGEAVFFYATGLGATNPVVSNGAAAPTNPVAKVTDTNLAVDIYDSQGNVTPVTLSFSGLVPGLAGVYQLNFTMPKGVAPGMGYLEVSTTDGFTSAAKIFAK